MPRIYSTASNPYDFCKAHMPPTEEAARAMPLLNDGDGPDGRGDCFGYDAEHPEYDGEAYTCTTCGKPLTDATDA